MLVSPPPAIAILARPRCRSSSPRPAVHGSGSPVSRWSSCLSLSSPASPLSPSSHRRRSPPPSVCAGQGTGPAGQEAGSLGRLPGLVSVLGRPGGRQPQAPTRPGLRSGPARRPAASGTRPAWKPAWADLWAGPNSKNSFVLIIKKNRKHCWAGLQIGPGRFPGRACDRGGRPPGRPRPGTRPGYA